MMLTSPLFVVDRIRCSFVGANRATRADCKPRSNTALLPSGHAPISTTARLHLQVAHARGARQPRRAYRRDARRLAHLRPALNLTASSVRCGDGRPSLNGRWSPHLETDEIATAEGDQHNLEAEKPCDGNIRVHVDRLPNDDFFSCPRQGSRGIRAATIEPRAHLAPMPADRRSARRMGLLQSRRSVRRPMAYVTESDETASSSQRRKSMSSIGRPADTESVAYEALMCWEWEGGALAPMQGGCSTLQSVDESRSVPLQEPQTANPASPRPAAVA